ncbi:hypothetical protein P5673_003612, partial [Acropora cervicornis]
MVYADGKTMSGKREKLKETAEEDFETFVRHQLSSISDDLKEMKGTQVQIQRDIDSLQSQTKKNESSNSKLKEALDVKLEVLTGELHETNTRIDRIENDITKYAKEIYETYERLLSLERYSRDYNLRFYNIPESTSEDCIAKLQGFSPMIFEATRITENSQSCIDHIFANISTSCSSGSLAVEIADHLPVPPYFNKVSNIHALLKKARIKHKAYKPWISITSGLMKSMKYKLYRNKIATVNKIYRDRFYNDILTKSDNMKKMWDNINLLINKKRPSSHIEKLLI